MSFSVPYEVNCFPRTAPQTKMRDFAISLPKARDWSDRGGMGGAAHFLV
jgi:hypothetical protein